MKSIYYNNNEYEAIVLTAVSSCNSGVKGCAVHMNQSKMVTGGVGWCWLDINAKCGRSCSKKSKTNIKNASALEILGFFCEY